MPAWRWTIIQDGRAAHISQAFLSECRPSCRGEGGGGADCFSSTQTSVSPPGGPATGSTHSCSKVSHMLPLLETWPLCCATGCLSLSSLEKMEINLLTLATLLLGSIASMISMMLAVYLQFSCSSPSPPALPPKKRHSSSGLAPCKVAIVAPMRRQLEADAPEQQVSDWSSSSSIT